MDKDNAARGADDGGLLSRVLKWVTRPAPRWPQPDQPETDSEAAGDTARLAWTKAVLERKRRNDFVRQREFNMLRKIRRRDLPGAALAAEPPFVHVSDMAGGDRLERKKTVEQIDKIEAEIKHSWLRRKTQTAPASAAASLPDAATTVAGMYADDSLDFSQAPPRAWMPALRADDGPPPSAALAQEPPMQITAPDSRLSSLPPLWVTLPGRLAQLSVLDAAPGLAPARYPPAIEEAAIHFANGDSAMAEAGLLELARNADDRDSQLQAWLTLLDLYRAVGMQGRFAEAALQMARRFERAAPAWSSPTEAAPPPSPGGAAAASIELKGEILGHATALLQAPEGADHAFRSVELQCRDLRRLDFGAVGDLLNWVIAKHAQGWQITFQQVNRLVAVFLCVMGIDEFARIMLRGD
jgi:hypothetical protein